MAFRDLYSRHADEKSLSFWDTADCSRAEPPGATTPGLIAIIWQRKALVLATAGLCIGAGLVYLAIAAPRYYASTTMLIDPRLGKTVGSDPLQPGFIVDTASVDSQVQLLISQPVLARVADMAGLASDPEFNGSDRSFLQRLLHPRDDLTNGVDLKAIADAISIKRPERTYVVEIGVLARDPVKAAEIANDLPKAYIEDQVGARVDAAQDDTKYVRQQLTKLAGEIRDAQEKVEAFKSKNNVVDTTGLRTNDQQVSDLTRQLADARARASSAKAKSDEIQRLLREGRLDAASQAIDSRTIELLRQQQSQAAENSARLATTLGKRHPALIEARAREAKVTGLIRDELHRVALASSADYQAAMHNEAQILAAVDQLKAQSTTISRDLVPLTQLERNVAVLRESFDRFARIRDNLSQQEASSPPGRVISVARPPVSPSQPRKTIVLGVASAAGLFLGLAAALLAESAQPPGRAPAAPSPLYDRPEPTRRPRSSRHYWNDEDAS